MVIYIHPDHILQGLTIIFVVYLDSESIFGLQHPLTKSTHDPSSENIPTDVPRLLLLTSYMLLHAIILTIMIGCNSASDALKVHEYF